MAVVVLIPSMRVVLVDRCDLLHPLRTSDQRVESGGNSKFQGNRSLSNYSHMHAQETKGRSRAMTWKSENTRGVVQTIQHILLLPSTSCYIIVVSLYLSVTGTNNPSNPPPTFPWPSFHTSVWSRRSLLGQNHHIAFASCPLTSFQILFLIFFRSVV
jgi:hypothetical protein